jgi:AcrR family transcriptional regulator
LEQAIFQAALHELSCSGYASLTMEGIAATAGTGKSALYRRWASKEELVVDALDHCLPPFQAPEGATLREDLLFLLGRMAQTMNGSAGCAVRAVMSHVERDDELARTVHERVLEPRKRAFLHALERAVDRGDARPGCATPLVAEVGPALLVHRVLSLGTPIPGDLAAQIVDEVLLPLTRS